MAQINKPTDYFNTIFYTGNNTADHQITGVGFRPEFFWTKSRNIAQDNLLFDFVRGTEKFLKANTTTAEDTQSGTVTSFDSDGVTFGASSAGNANGYNYVAWSWLAGGTASSNTDGSITSSVSANTTSGFSIVSYTGTGANATVGHGLGVAPKVLIIKERDNAQEWHNGFDAIGWDKYMHFNTDAQATSSLPFQSTAPTSSVFSLGASNGTNRSGGGMIAYCFAEKKGFSKFGKYRGNSSSDGVFVYLGFKPAMVMVKSNAVEAWEILDNKRSNSFNAVDGVLFPNLSNAEETTNDICDFLSNGIALFVK